MGFVKTEEELRRYFSLGERKFIGAKMMGVMFQTKPEIAGRLLPEPLEPSDNPGGLIFIAEYPQTNLGPGYNEAALFLRCQYRGEKGSYCLSMPITREGRMHNGRDVFGFPKKMATIEMKRNHNKVHGWVERHGIRFVEIKITLTGSLPILPKMGPTFLFKAMPRIDLQPGFDGPVLLCRQETDIQMKSLEIGNADVILREAEEDPWAEVEISNIQIAFYLVSHNTMKPGKVLTEVDPIAYLPHYFKMTDFYQG